MKPCHPQTMSTSTRSVAFDEQALTLSSQQRLLLSLEHGWSVVPDTTDTGVFLAFKAHTPATYLVHPLGAISGLKKFTSLYRFSPFWTRPALGHNERDVQPETQWLLAECGVGHFTLIVPLIDGATHFSLRSLNGRLAVAAETGEAALATHGGTALFVATGNDPYALMAASARAVQTHIGRGRLRTDKPLPEFVNYFGWCTWDAFYKDVSAEKVLTALASFREVGVPPRWMILDDGWQTWRPASSGEDRLIHFSANERFDGDLTSLIASAKSQYGIEYFLVWHALLGYWGGVDETAFSEYGVRSVARSFGPGLLEQESRWNVWPWGAQIGVPAKECAGTFFDTLHADLARQGVDGVKVDSQATLEAVCAGQGGRVATAEAYRQALEASVKRHFNGRLVNCMSVTSECIYLSAESTLMRTSDDFFPNRAESHGPHLYANALAGVWLGEFMQPDWDMFQSAHPFASLHAAARAISGGPVYVSDKIGAHDAALLRKLVLTDGSILRADFPARPTLDCLFVDPTCEPALLKIFNLNGDCAVVGLFNVAMGLGVQQGSVAPSDIPALSQTQEYVAWAHCNERFWHCSADKEIFELGETEWEIVSFAPIEKTGEIKFAAIGLVDKFNSTRAIVRREWDGDVCRVTLRDGGTFLSWSPQPPTALLCNGLATTFTYDAASGCLQAQPPTGGPCILSFFWR